MKSLFLLIPLMILVACGKDEAPVTTQLPPTGGTGVPTSTTPGGGLTAGNAHEACSIAFDDELNAQSVLAYQNELEQFNWVSETCSGQIQQVYSFGNRGQIDGRNLFSINSGSMKCFSNVYHQLPIRLSPGLGDRLQRFRVSRTYLKGSRRARILQWVENVSVDPQGRANHVECKTVISIFDASGRHFIGGWMEDEKNGSFGPNLNKIPFNQYLNRIVIPYVGR